MAGAAHRTFSTGCSVRDPSFPTSADFGTLADAANATLRSRGEPAREPDMRTIVLVAAALAAATSSLFRLSEPQDSRAAASPTVGALVIVGGGAIGEGIVARALELAGGRGIRVLVIPQASGVENPGAGAVALWTAAGAGAAEILRIDDAAAARRQIDAAQLIWIGGGDQNRLMKALETSQLVSAIRARAAAGVVVGGTSAGAAVMSAVMLTGEADGEGLTAQTTATAPGLGFVPGLIVDQHFHKRRRFNRLLSAVLDAPKLVGAGIDESTALIVRGRTLEVAGKSSVVIVDARKAEVGAAERGAPLATRGVDIHVVRTGETFELDFDPFTAPAREK
jgi:cyanophycinase